MHGAEFWNSVVGTSWIFECPATCLHWLFAVSVGSQDGACGNKPQEGGVWYGPESQGGRHVFTVSLADLYVPGSCKQTVIK